MKILRAIDDNLEEILLVLLTIYFVFVTVAQVLARHIFKVPAAWTEESGRYAFIWITFIGTAYASKRGTHVRVDILESYLNPKNAAKFKLAAMVVFLLFTCVMAVAGLDICRSAIAKPQYSPALQIPMSFVYAAMPVGMFLSSFRLIQWIYRNYLKKVGEGS